MINREILLAFWKVHILYHAAEGPIYGQWILKELRRHGYDISPGTVYPLLQRLGKRGWLISKTAAKAGPRGRRNYVLTKEGAKVLALLREKVAEMHREVVLEQEEKHRE